MKPTSQTTFLYFDDLERARRFFDEVLALEVVYDPVWSCVWRTGEKSFIGAVDRRRGAIPVQSRGGTLISLTVDCIQDAYAKLKNAPGVSDVTHIRTLEDIGIKSFLFTGPEGYRFEIQEFSTVELRKLF